MTELKWCGHCQQSTLQTAKHDTKAIESDGKKAVRHSTTWYCSICKRFTLREGKIVEAEKEEK